MFPPRLGVISALLLLSSTFVLAAPRIRARVVSLESRQRIQCLDGECRVEKPVCYGELVRI